ncbi:hypothetical protein [Corynebacterium propinquum]
MSTAQYDEATRARVLGLYYEAVAEEGATNFAIRRKIGGMHDWISKAEAAEVEATTQNEQEKTPNSTSFVARTSN